MVVCKYLAGQSLLYAFDTMIFVANGKKKSGIEYPIAYLLSGGAIFLENPSPGEEVAQNRVGTQIKYLFTVYKEFGGVQVIKMTAY